MCDDTSCLFAIVLPCRCQIFSFPFICCFHNLVIHGNIEPGIQMCLVQLPGVIAITILPQLFLCDDKGGHRSQIYLCCQEMLCHASQLYHGVSDLRGREPQTITTWMQHTSTGLTKSPCVEPADPDESKRYNSAPRIPMPDIWPDNGKYQHQAVKFVFNVC